MSHHLRPILLCDTCTATTSPTEATGWRTDGECDWCPGCAEPIAITLPTACCPAHREPPAVAETWNEFGARMLADFERMIALIPPCTLTTWCTLRACHAGECQEVPRLAAAVADFGPAYVSRTRGGR